MSIEMLAEAIHKAYQAFLGRLGISLIPWEAMTDQQRFVYIATVRLVLADPDYFKGSHEAWVAEQEIDGWSRGTVFCSIRKINPSVVPYSDLPKDKLAGQAIMTALCNVYRGRIDS